MTQLLDSDLLGVWNFSICVTGIINLITVDLRAYSLKYLASVKKGESKGSFGSGPYLLELGIQFSNLLYENAKLSII